MTVEYAVLTSSGILRWSVDFIEMVMSEMASYMACSANGRGL